MVLKLAKLERVGWRRLVSRVLDDKVRWATWAGLVLYGIESLLYLALGQLNADEGWYLYGGKLALQGLLPFRDFAYTQMPLLPYIYGVLQIPSPGLVAGRLTSIAISLGAVGMGIVVARRYAGSRGGALAALLFAAFTFGIYFNTIVKTYALVSFFFIATLFVLSSSVAEERRYPLALLFALAAALVRVTALLFVVPILVYVLLNANRWRTRVAVLLESALAVLVTGFFVLPDWPAARWDLFDSHLRHWAGAQASTQIYHVLAERLPDIVQQFGLVLVLFAGALYFLFHFKGIRYFLGDRLPIWITALGLGLFAAAHLVNGLWDVEYLVPAATALLPILAIVLSQVYEDLESLSRLFVQGILVVVLLLVPLSESIGHVDVTGRRLPLAEVNAAAAFIAEHSEPQDEVLALEALSSVLPTAALDAARNDAGPILGAVDGPASRGASASGQYRDACRSRRPESRSRGRSHGKRLEHAAVVRSCERGRRWSGRWTGNTSLPGPCRCLGKYTTREVSIYLSR